MTALPRLATAEKRKARSRRRGDGPAALGFLSPNLAGFLVFTILPIVASLVLSFYEWPLIGVPEFTGLHNFTQLLTKDVVFRNVILNTLYFVVGYLAGNIIVSLGLASWLTTRVRG